MQFAADLIYHLENTIVSYGKVIPINAEIRILTHSERPLSLKDDGMNCKINSSINHE